MNTAWFSVIKIFYLCIKQLHLLILKHLEHGQRLVCKFQIHFSQTVLKEHLLRALGELLTKTQIFVI